MTDFALIPVLQQIVDALKPVLVFFHDLGLGWGMTIVALTCVVRALMLPLAFKSFKSMQAMARVTPEIKALQKKYENDKQRQQQELMKFYSENQINPFAACLPLIIQLPFFLGLFYLLQSDLRNEICGQTTQPCGDYMLTAADMAAGFSSGNEEFLFIADLTDKSTGMELVALIVLYIGTQLVSSMMSMTTMDRNQKLIMYALPFVFTIFIINFPAGLIVYWITTNTWTMGQQALIRKKLGPMRPPTPPGEESAAGSLLEKITGREPATAEAGSGGARGPAAPPPPPPRKKKKRSGRRR